MKSLIDCVGQTVEIVELGRNKDYVVRASKRYSAETKKWREYVQVVTDLKKIELILTCFRLQQNEIWANGMPHSISYILHEEDKLQCLN
jgi:hypothetical protein